MSFRVTGEKPRPVFRNSTDEWFKRPKISRWANALYPQLADKQTQQQMLDVVKSTEPEKAAGLKLRMQQKYNPSSGLAKRSK
jgi:hypothetical protein